MEYYRFIEYVKYWEKQKYINEYSRKEMVKTVRERIGARYNLSEVHRTEKKLDEIRGELDSIKSTYFYKVWQKYCEARNKIFQR